MDEEIIACLSCMAPNPATIAFCEKCGAPIGTTSTLDPLKMIRAEGFLLKKATTDRPKPIVLFGVWIIFLPWLAGSILLAGSQILYGFDFEGFVFFWIGVGLAMVALIILYRVTKNYFAPLDLEQNEEDSIDS